MYSKVNYTIIGTFVLLFAAGVIFFAFWLGGSGFKDDYNLYMLRMKESVAGLSKDSSVKLKGVEIGTVDEISVNPKDIEEVEIVLKIREDIPIKEDMRGVITMFGLTGLSFIEIQGGTNSAKRLVATDGKMPVIKAGVSTLVDLEDKVEDISSKLSIVLKRGEQVLSDENLKNFSALLDNANRFAQKGNSILDETNVTLREIRLSFDALSKMANSVGNVAITIDKSVKRGDYNMQKIMQPTMNDIRELSTQIDTLTRELRQSPSDILYKSSTPRKGPGE